MHYNNLGHAAQHTSAQPESTGLRDRFRGCLLGGAVGDALGAPVEFMTRAAILDRFGAGGIREFVPAYGRLGAFTDDTQMTLFTAEGVLRAQVRRETRGICHPPSIISKAYLRWLHTQGIEHALHSDGLSGWLVQQRELHSNRAPGRTCLSALERMTSSGDKACNHSKGCGGVMRVAPIAMFFASGVALRRLPRTAEELAAASENAFQLAVEAAAITHGHPTGQLASGAFVTMVMGLLWDVPLRTAADAALLQLRNRPDHEETTQAIERALLLASSSPADHAALRELGEGWIAEEALAITLYCALSHEYGSFKDAVVLAVNHDGDSDSTGSMVGQLLGASMGVAAIPASWLESLELRWLVEQVADDLAASSTQNEDTFSDDYLERYPGY